MTTPSPDRGAVSVEPMTDSVLRVMRTWTESGGAWCASSDVARILARLDRAESRALPYPRRYTGGPLEDGLYLWRRPWWHATSWAAFAVESGRRHAFMGPTLYSTEAVDVWLIGPIHIPPIPESEEPSNG